MKRLLAVSFAILACASMMAAQAIDQYQPRKFDPQAVQTQPTQILDLAASRASADLGCPAAFTARQGGNGNLISVKPGEKSDQEKGVSQRIHLSVAGLKNASVIEAQVTVHGLAPRARVVAVRSGAGGPEQISRTMNVGFSNESAGGSAADLLVGGYSAVFSIDVDSITYADGSTWRSGNGTCRVVPDPMMLIGLR